MARRRSSSGDKGPRIDDPTVFNTLRVGHIRESILRIDLHCNENCPFCFVALRDERMSLKETDRYLSDLAAQSDFNRVLTISGGEPTGHPDLPKIIGQAREKGFKEIVLQTNAVMLADPGLAEALSGLTFFTSFHSHIPEIYDKVTGSVGQFDRAVSGIKAILRRKENKVQLNIVVTRFNFSHLPDHVDFIAGLNEECGAQAQIFFSMLNDVGLKKAPDFEISIEEVAPHLNEALARCDKAGITVSPFIGDCAFPLCSLQEPQKRAPGVPCHQEGLSYVARPPQLEDVGRVKAMTCKDCAYDDRCRGVFAAYAARFGLGSLKPISK